MKNTYTKTTTMKTNKVLTFGAALLFAATVMGQSAIQKHSQTPTTNQTTHTLNSCGVTADFQYSQTCLGMPTSFTDSSYATGGQTIVSWHWNFDIQDTIGYYTQNPTHVFNSAGTYTISLIVSSNLGCIDTLYKSIYISGLTPTAYVVQNVSSDSTYDGILDVAAGGGQGPYTYSWSNGVTTSNNSGLSKGCYTVTVYDASGCNKSISLCLDDSSQLGCTLTASISSSTNVSSPGFADGSATVSVANGTGPYVYSWNNSSTAQTNTGLVAGCYTVVVTDVNNCTAAAAVCITEPGQTGCTLNAFIQSVSNVSTYGGSDGAISISTTGAIGSNITYSWSNGGIFTNISNVGSLTAGCYTVVVSDTIGCTSTVSTCITQPADSCDLMPNITMYTAVSSPGGSDGALTVTPFAGTAPYTYSWNTGATTATISNLPVGVYYVYITDSKNCVDSVSAILSSTAGAGTLNVTAENFNAISYCDTNNTTSSGYAWVTNGTPPYTYSWSNGSTSFSISGLPVGCYTVVVTDANNATGTASACVTQSTPIQFTPVVKNVNCFDTLSGEISLGGFSGGAAPFLISATNATDSINAAWGTTVIPNLPEGTYNVTVNDANGCQVTQQTTIIKANCDVWPGDANADLVANNYDLLPIGLGFGDTGPTRAGATTNWVAQACTDWTNNQVSGVNFKHADCNGDGVINADDTTAIKLNYGQTHNKNNYSLPAGPNDPELAIVIPQDSAVGGTLVTGNIMLGTQAIPADVYGLAFSLAYDASIVKPGTMTVSFSNNWMGNASNVLSIHKDVYGSGKIDAALTRIDKQNVSGAGQIGTVSFILKDDVSGKDVVYNQLNIMPINVVMIGSNGVQIPVNLTGDSIIGSTDVTGIKNIVRSSSNLIVYPNPAGNVVNVTAGGETMEWIRITNIVGEIVYQSNDQVSKATINTSELSAGTYYLQVKSNSGIAVKPIMINK